MKTILRKLTLAWALLMSVPPVLADGLQCRHGLTWTISHNKAWGYGQPIITNIKPNSGADIAGLRVADIIEEIDGYATHNLSPKQIQQLLSQGDKLHTIKTSNLGRVGSKHILGLQCKPCNSFTERELAELFSLYSIEDANLQRIHYPYHYTQSTNYPWLNVKLFDVAVGDPRTADIDRKVNESIKSALQAKGLTLSEYADVVLSSYYHLEPLNTSEQGADVGLGFSWRYDMHKRGLRPMPLYSTQPSSIGVAKYKLVFGLQMQSRRSKDIVWSCEATEYLSEAISIAEYAEAAVGTMLLGFPFVKDFNTPLLSAHTLNYNYTGVLYSQNNLNLIVGIEDNSPAMKAGLRPGDIIQSINGQRLDIYDSNTLVERYLGVAERLQRYRDRDLPPLEALVGGIPVSYWRVDNYESVASQLSKDSNDTAFSYLFAFRPYILGKEGKVVIYEILRNGQIYFVPISPEYRNETTISTL